MSTKKPRKPGSTKGGKGSKAVKRSRAAAASKASGTARKGGGIRMPTRGTGTEVGGEREEGPRGWLFPTRESTYTKLTDRTAATPTRARRGSRALAGADFESSLQPGAGAEVLADVPESHWLDVLSEYQRRKGAGAPGAAPSATAARRGGPPGPFVPGQKNWSSLGPSVVLEGQAYGRPAVGGRVSGLAVARGGQLVYAATANGGVFRSDDGGVSWRALMDAFDLDPTHFASTSLACGAIAIDGNDPDRIYVGTGEGDTHGLFGTRIINSLPAYRGIGPIRSDDGGQRWISEPTAAGAPSLAGKAFYALAVDPKDRENVVGATTEGLYQRVSKSGGVVEWTRRKAGIFTSVVAASAGPTKRFFAARQGGGVYRSGDGSTWSALGSGFPTTDVGRIALGVQPGNPNLVYAFVANTKGAARGVFRLSGVNGTWKEVTNLPDVLPAEDGYSQGDYDLAIAVDPSDPDLIYLGGSYYNDEHEERIWPASVWRCRVQALGSALKAQGVIIGKQAHADVHVLTHSPGDPDSLWVGCDGGVFLNRAPRAAGVFASRNNGLACLCTNFFAQHPTDPSIIFCGLQDNGTARTGGGPIWRGVRGADGGYCLINWADPKQVLVFENGRVWRHAGGGAGQTGWQLWNFKWALMTEPIVGPPYNPSAPEEAKLVALGAGPHVYLSKTFGASWLQSDVVPIPTAAGIYAISFASPKRFFVGTTRSEVFRVDKTGNTWQVTRIDDGPGGALPEQGIVSDIAIDWSDAQLNSVYIAFGGIGDYRHVWHYDGTRWEARSGQPGTATELLDVEHNAITVDRDAPSNVYVGADIGVWHSPDAGRTWNPLPNGLPDAPVFDLQIHPTRRLLRASTHGRGIYEYRLD